MAAKKSRTKKLSWRQLQKLNPKAFEQFMESALDYVSGPDQEGFSLHERNGKLYTNGSFPGNEWGGGILQVWNGRNWEESSDDWD